MIDGLECNKNGFAPWIGSWPCDPNGPKYHIVTDGTDCPRVYRLLTNLNNRQDGSIPGGWYSRSPLVRYGDGTLTINDINYGISSQDISWDSQVVPAYCFLNGGGCQKTLPGLCQALAGNVKHYDANLSLGCLPECEVSCCYNGQICN